MRKLIIAALAFASLSSNLKAQETTFDTALKTIIAQSMLVALGQEIYPTDAESIRKRCKARYDDDAVRGSQLSGYLHCEGTHIADFTGTWAEVAKINRPLGDCQMPDYNREIGNGVVIVREICNVDDGETDISINFAVRYDNPTAR